MESGIICRICLDEIEGQYIKPCNCRSGNYHKECIERWILTNNKMYCEVCTEKYTGIEFKYSIVPYYLCNSIIVYICCLLLLLIMINVDDLFNRMSRDITKFIDTVISLFIGITGLTLFYIYQISKNKMIYVKKSVFL